MNRQFDVFLSFKNLDDRKKPTRDSHISAELYKFLTEKGLSVFQSNIVLEELGEAAFKKAIDRALDSAKVLVAIGTSSENLESEWVRYEWDSFYSDILNGIKPEGKLFTYIEGVRIKALPRTLRQTQTLVHGPGSIRKLYNFISNALKIRRPEKAVDRKQLMKAFNIAPGSKAPDLHPLNWTDAPKASFGHTDLSPVDFQRTIDDIRNDPGLKPSDMSILIHMRDAALLDEKAASILQDLQDLDKAPGGGSSKRQQALMDQLEAIDKERQEIMDRLKKMQNDQAEGIRRLFEK